MTKFETNRRTALKLVLASGALTLMVPRALFAASQQELTYQVDGMTVPLLIIHGVSNNIEGRITQLTY